MPSKRKQVKRVLKNTIYLRAAKNVHAKMGKDKFIFSCNEIDVAARGYNTSSRRRYEQLFKPNYAWVAAWLDHSDVPYKDRNEWRIMALLFMHAMVNNP